MIFRSSAKQMVTVFCYLMINDLTIKCPNFGSLLRSRTIICPLKNKCRPLTDIYH